MPWRLRDSRRARVGGFEAWIDLTEVTGPNVGITAWAYPVDGEPFVLDETVLELAMVDAAEDSARRLRQRALAERWSAYELRFPERARDSLDLVVFTHDLHGGGAQAWLWELLSRSGAGRSFPCTVIAPAPGPQAGAFEALGIPVHITRPCPVWDIESYEGAVAELGAFVSGGGHTAVLINTFVPFIGADVAARLGLPCVWAIHESYQPRHIVPVLYAPSGIDPLVQEAALRSLSRASRGVFVSQATRDLFLSILEPSRALVVPYGVDTSAIDALRSSGTRASARQELGVPADATLVLSVGVTEPRKSQTTTAVAFAQVAEEYPDAILAFVGAVPGSYADGLHQFLDEAGLGDRSRVVPFSSDPAQWYLAADLFISASDVESLPRAMLEAMCFAVPVLATSVFGVPEVIEDDRNGWLFEASSVAATAAGLRRVLGCDAARRAAIGAAGAATVHDKFDLDGYVTAVPRLLHSLVGEQVRDS